MIRAIALAAAIAWGAGQATAQGTIRGGEHPDFTRIVVPIGQDRDFEIENDGRRWLVRLDPAASFNTNGVFGRLSSGRLAGIESDETLVLELGCACRIQAERYDGSYLILDIFDAPEEELAPPPTAEIVATPVDDGEPDDASPPYRPDAPLALDLLEQAATLVPRLSPLEPGMAQPPSPVLGPGPAVALQAQAPRPTPRPDELVQEIPEPLPRPEAVSETAEALAEQVARATAAGLLETSADEPLTAGDQPRDRAQPEIAEIPTEPPDDIGLPVRAANAFDIAGNRDSGLTAVAAALSCSEPIGDLESWSGGLSFASGIGPLRQAAHDATGALDGSAAGTLARFYIFHGFGAEAEAWLLQLADPPEVELAMARYLDERPGPNFRPVETLALCSGLDLLWRFVDAPDFPELALSQRQEMRLAFFTMPLALRRQLGPDFVRQLAAHGYHVDAEDVREALARGPTLDTTEELLLELETQTGPISPHQTDRLQETLEMAGPDVARVMREYLAALRADGVPPDAGTVIAAEALLREEDPDLTPGSLWHEVLLAHAATSEISAILTGLNEISGAQVDEKREIFDSVFAALLAAPHYAAAVIVSVHIAAETDGPAVSRTTRLAVHEMLTSYSLHELAMPYGSPSGAMRDYQTEPVRDPTTGAAISDRIAALDSPVSFQEPFDPDQARDVVDDSRALRAEIAEMLDFSAAN